MSNQDKPSFLKNHSDTIAIMGLNIGIAAILIGLWMANMASIAATNMRMDTMYVMFYDLLKSRV